MGNKLYRINLTYKCVNANAGKDGEDLDCCSLCACVQILTETLYSPAAGD
ncbi:hypothetical protein Nmel_011604, partial [Mimus melanotis]